MFRAGLTLMRRVIFAACLLVLLVCGAEVGVRVYEGVTGDTVCRPNDVDCGDPLKLTVPSWSFYQELKPSAFARVECRDTDSEIELRTNSIGLRGPEPAIPKPPEVFRVVVIGDETILAPETPESDHFCTVLQNLLQQQSRSKVEVINAGVPGHCPLTEYLLFKQRLMSLQPDLVMLHYDWSDAADDRKIRRHARCDANKVPQSCPNSKLIAVKKVRPQDVWRQQFRLVDWGLSTVGNEWKKKLERQTAISRDVDTNPYAWLREERPQQNVAFRNSVRPIVDLAQLCRSSQCPFVLLTSPKPWQVSAKCSRGEGVRLAAGVAREACFSSREPFNVLARFAQNAKIPFVDGSTVMTPGQDAEANFLRHAPRWSPTGHRRFAELVGNYIIENASGPWNVPYTPQNVQPVNHSEPRENLSEVNFNHGKQQ